MTVNQLTNDQARTILEQILSTSEFAHNHLLEQLENWIKSLLSKNHPDLPTHRMVDWDMVTMVLMGIVAVAGFILIAYLTRNISPFWNLMVKEARQDQTTGIVQRRSTPADLLMNAEQQALRGEFRLALRDLYMSILMDMNNRQLISYESGKTNNEYLYEIRQRAVDLKESFQSMVNLFEYKWYGLESCTDEDFKRGRELYLVLLKDGSHG